MHQNRRLLNAASLCADHRIDYRENGNFVNMPCPFCYKNDDVFGLGYSTTTGGFYCFKCGKLTRWETIAALLDITIHQAANVCKQYETPTRPRSAPDDALQANVGGVLEVKLPYGTGPMTNRHKEYLQARQFDPDRLEAEWGLLGTGPVGPFAHRIIIPVRDRNGKVVCFQGRDVTNLSPTRYKSCPDALAVTSIKNCLYGSEKVRGDTIVIVEGAAKVWRLGLGSVATFGAVVTDAQLLVLKQFRRQCIVFDGDDTGREAATKLAQRLVVLGGTVFCYDLPDGVGPDDLSDEDARELMTDVKRNSQTS